MASPSASTEALALAIRLSSVMAGFGRIETVGAVGVVLTLRLRLTLSVSPIGSVAVTEMLCWPALRELVLR